MFEVPSHLGYGIESILQNLMSEIDKILSP